MNVPLYALIAPPILVIGSVAILTVARRQAQNSVSRAVTYENAHEAAGMLSAWATWFAGIGTSAMAAVGFLSDKASNDWEKCLGMLALGFLALSTVGFGWLLASLPSVRQRLRWGKFPHRSTTDNDIYVMPLFEKLAPKHKWLTVEFASAFSHYSGLVGMLFLAFFFGASVVSKDSPDGVETSLKRIARRLEQPIKLEMVKPKEPLALPSLEGQNPHTTNPPPRQQKNN